MAPEETEAFGAPPISQIMPMIWGFMVSQAVHVAAKLGVFDELRDKPRAASELAEATDSEPRALRRLLRMLTAVNMLIEDEQGRFSSTTLGAFLESNHPQSIRSLALMYGEPFFWRAWGDLYQTVKTGNPGFERVHGETFFEYLGRHPHDAAIFNAGMTSATGLDVPAILNAYDFSAFATIVDVGGGHGALLRGILERYPNAKGVLCDQPSVVAEARAIVHSDVATRCQLVGTDMFESVPAGGDAYILKKIIHDWNDDEATRILQNCRRAIAATGKLLVIDNVLKPPNQPDPAKLMDLNMLVLLTGCERTEEEFRELYSRAGFRLTRIVQAMRIAIVEGVPA